MLDPRSGVWGYFYPTSWIIPAPFLGPDVHRLWSYTRPSPTNLRTDLSSLCITQALYAV